MMMLHDPLLILYMGVFHGVELHAAFKRPAYFSNSVGRHGPPLVNVAAPCWKM